MAYSRFEPFSSVDIPDDVRDANVAQWKAAQDVYDPVAGARPQIDAGSSQAPGDPSAALSGAQMPHADWQTLRAQQLAARDAGSVLAAATSTPTAPRPATPIDPNRTQVFQPGPNGKLQPIPGWHTTGPFDFGAWAKNVDWNGVGRDLGRIGVQSLIGLAPLPAPWEQLSRLKDFYDYGKDTLEDLKRADEPSGR